MMFLVSLALILSFCLSIKAIDINPQHCGPANDAVTCQPGACCSYWGWCGFTDTHCMTVGDNQCFVAFSGPGSRCQYPSHQDQLSYPSSTLDYSTPVFSVSSVPEYDNAATLEKSTEAPSYSTEVHYDTQYYGEVSDRPTPVVDESSKTTVYQAQLAYMTTIPDIDVCGASSSGVSCPGAGLSGYFYRCCSAHGHCGPKNTLQDQSLYCGDGCQAGYGKCNSMPVPPLLSPTATSSEGDTCGPIVRLSCPNGLCCSGSNFCGTNDSFCGSDNWCQPAYGYCNPTTIPAPAANTYYTGIPTANNVPLSMSIPISWYSTTSMSAETYKGEPSRMSVYSNEVPVVEVVTVTEIPSIQLYYSNAPSSVATSTERASMNSMQMPPYAAQSSGRNSPVGVSVYTKGSQMMTTTTIAYPATTQAYKPATMTILTEGAQMISIVGAAGAGQIAAAYGNGEPISESTDAYAASPRYNTGGKPAEP